MLIVQMITHMSTKKESDFVIINTKPLKRIFEDLDTAHVRNVNTPMQDLIAAFNTVEARIRLEKIRKRWLDNNFENYFIFNYLIWWRGTQ